MKSKPSSVAGVLYPDNSDELTTMLAAWLLAEDDFLCGPRALIVPDSDLVLTGRITAKTFKTLKHQSRSIRRVVVIAATSQLPMDGCIVSTHDAYTTPLGDVEIDAMLRRELLQQSLVFTDDLTHVLAQSIELQLPFLQMCLTDFVLMPIVVGRVLPRDLLQLLRALPDASDTLIVLATSVSSLSANHQTLLHQRLRERLVDKWMHKSDDIDTEVQAELILSTFLTFCQEREWSLAFTSPTHTVSGIVAF